VRARPEIASLHDEQYGAFRGQLERLLAESGVPQAELRMRGIELTALVDGLWLELCLSPQAFSADEAGAIARAALLRITSSDRATG
ncbi:MAG: TetR family transcriptional regulator C-terminal domain-containing protein, partial [Novosphingobium sp.]